MGGGGRSEDMHNIAFTLGSRPKDALPGGRDRTAARRSRIAVENP